MPAHIQFRIYRIHSSYTHTIHTYIYTGYNTIQVIYIYNTGYNSHITHSSAG